MTEAAAMRVGKVRRVPRSCSNVFRLWAAVGLGLLLSIVIQLVIDGLDATGWRAQRTPAQQAFEEDFGGDLVGWLGFAVCYLGLGIRAFVGCSRTELVRRLIGSPLPRSTVKRWLLAGGGGVGWPIVIALWAFTTVATTVANRDNVPALSMVLAGVTVLLCIAVIAFSFAVHYARKDVEEGGLEFPGSDGPVFSDYIYFAVGTTVTFGTTDTVVVSNSMRQTVTVHSVLGWILNTVVIAVFLSVIT